jgi:predicted DNA-binding protein (MmcQ/YjbR family)
MGPEAVAAECRALPGTSEGYPFGEDVLVFKVAGKVFAILGGSSLSLKCDPAYAELFRREYRGVTPGYHLNKRHWNTIRLDGSVPGDVLIDWIRDSYELVVASMPRAARPHLQA